MAIQCSLSLSDRASCAACWHHPHARSSFPWHCLLLLDGKRIPNMAWGDLEYVCLGYFCYLRQYIPSTGVELVWVEGVSCLFLCFSLQYEDPWSQNPQVHNLCSGKGVCNLGVAEAPRLSKPGRFRLCLPSSGVQGLGFRTFGFQGLVSFWFWLSGLDCSPKA